MAAMSDYLENMLIDFLLRRDAVASYQRPQAIYLGLNTSDPTDEADDTEVSADEYERQLVTFSAGSDGLTSNTNTVTFPTASSTWGTVTHWTLWDSEVGGNLMFHGVGTTTSVTNGVTYEVAIGRLNIQFR